jgi:elongator complex protein 1
LHFLLDNMRNLIRIQDALHDLHVPTDSNHPDDHIVSLSCNQALGKLYLLTLHGQLHCCETHDGLCWKYSTILLFDDIQEHWMKVDYVAVTNTVVCLSREGSLASIEEDPSTGFPGPPEQIGAIDGGIAAAAWHPDYSSLVLLTNTHNLLCMSNAWDVLNEVPFVPHCTESVGNGNGLSLPSCSLSWKGDGELLSIVSTDQDDRVAKVRVLNPQLEVVAVSRQVGEGSGAVVRGIGSVAAFATNGAYIATITQKAGAAGGGPVGVVAMSHQVTLLEKNGLRHGDFDILAPPVTLFNNSTSSGYGPWTVTALEWDIPSTLLAVAMTASSSAQDGRFLGCVQLYYRENYRWYLKQQWVEPQLQWLGFDSEVVNRCYFSQHLKGQETADTKQEREVQERSPQQLFRVVDIYWATSRAETRDSSVCVTDGNQLLLTPLGYHTVPPPMSMYQCPLSKTPSSVAVQVAFWTRNE